MKKVYFLLLFFILLYFVLFPQKMSQAVSINRNWKISLNNKDHVSNNFSSESKLIKTDSFISKIDSNGSYKSLEYIRYAAAVTENYFINYDAVSQSLVVMDSEGNYYSSLDTRGYPYFTGSRLFVITTDRGAMREWTVDGDPMKYISFPSVLTSLSSSPDLLAAGFLNGEIWLYNDEISQLETPGISRYQVVYGIASAQTKPMIAAVTGIDPQFLSVYAKIESTFVPVSTQDLGSDFRRSVYMKFFAEDEYAVVESKEGIDIFSTKDWKKIKSIKLDGFFDAEYDDSRNLFLFSDQSGGLVITSPVSPFKIEINIFWEGVRFGTFKSSVFFHKDDRVCNVSVISGDKL